MASDVRLRWLVRLQKAAVLVLTLAIVALAWPSSLGGQVDFIMVSGESMEPGMHTGDLVIVRRTGDYTAGDAIAYRVPEGKVGAGATIIHRVVGGNGDQGYDVQGDNRDEADLWHPTDADVVGERWVLLPGMGDLVAELRNPAPLGILAGLVAFVMTALPRRRPRGAVLATE